MILEKIISGGQTGADRAALDVAIKFEIKHGGWIPKGRKAEDGPLSSKYLLKEMDSTDYRERTKQNILDSHGTVIISRGKLSGGSKLTHSFAKVIGRPNCYIDLLSTEEFEAAIILKSFILENQINVLNVAGPRLSHHPEIYQDVKTIFEAALYLLYLDAKQDIIIEPYMPSEIVKEDFPESISTALSILRNDLSLKAKAFIAKSDNSDIRMLYFGLLDYARHRMGFDSENKILHKICVNEFGGLPDNNCTIEDVVMEIIKQLKVNLEKDYLLRVVK